MFLFYLLLSTLFIPRKQFCKCQISDQMCVNFMCVYLLADHTHLRLSADFIYVAGFCFLPDSIQTYSCQRHRSCGCGKHTVLLHCRTASLPLSRQKDTFQSPLPCPDSTFMCSLIGWPSLTCLLTAAEKPCSPSVGRQQWPGKLY